MPVPTIFLINAKKEIVEMKSQAYESEDRLQSLLAKFPSILAGDQISGSAPLKWLLVKREAGVPGEVGGSERWSLDHLFIDQNGVPTLVEVKRRSDTRIRREVVGQMLDYAANAVEYWPVETLQQWFEETCREERVDCSGRITEVLQVSDPTERDAAIGRFWGTVETNLRAGKLRLVFAADQIPQELRRIIEFLDEQMPSVEVLGIEIQQYVGPNVHTLVPSVIRSARKSGTIHPRPVQWKEQSFISALSERRGSDAVKVATDILNWAKDNADVKLSWGEGRVTGSCFIGITHNQKSYEPAAIWTNGRIQLQYQTLQQRGVPTSAIEALSAALNEIPDLLPETLVSG